MVSTINEAVVHSEANGVGKIRKSAEVVFGISVQYKKRICQTLNTRERKKKKKKGSLKMMKLRALEPVTNEACY